MSIETNTQAYRHDFATKTRNLRRLAAAALCAVLGLPSSQAASLGRISITDFAISLLPFPAASSSLDYFVTSAYEELGVSSTCCGEDFILDGAYDDGASPNWSKSSALHISQNELSATAVDNEDNIEVRASIRNDDVSTFDFPFYNYASAYVHRIGSLNAKDKGIIVFSGIYSIVTSVSDNGPSCVLCYLGAADVATASLRLRATVGGDILNVTPPTRSGEFRTNLKAFNSWGNFSPSTPLQAESKPFGVAVFVEPGDEIRFDLYAEVGAAAAPSIVPIPNGFALLVVAVGCLASSTSHRQKSKLNSQRLN